MVAHDVKSIFAAQSTFAEERDQKDHLTFRDIWLFLKRNLLLFMICGSAGLGLGVLYLVNAAPKYAAVARVVMDPGQAKIASQDATSGTIIIESAEIASQVEIVKSEAVARAVIESLNLTEDPEIQTSTSWRSKVRDILTDMAVFAGLAEPKTGEAEISEDQLMRRTMAGFLARVSARRVGQSYVLEIGYTSVDPEHASRTANAIAQTYIRSGMEERSMAAKRGAAWLEERLIEVGKQARQSQMAVEEYRASNGITPVGTTSSLDQQQLVETSTQLLSAQSETATQLARLETIKRMIAGHDQDANIDDPIEGAQIQVLRDELRAAAVKLDQIKQRYRPDNAAVLSAQADVARLEAELQNEYLRIEGIQRSNLEIARAKERIINAGLNNLQDKGFDNNMARVDLAELESRATTYRRMYESVLQQMISALQIQSFPLGTARIVTAATTPFTKASPRTSAVLPLSLILGIAAGFGIAGWREGMNRSLGNGSRGSRELGIALLGDVPSRTGLFPFGSQRKQRNLPRRLMPLRAILDTPYSDFAECIRSIKSTIDAANKPGAALTVGITSMKAGEGKTTIAVNLAQLYLNEGIDTIIIDADFQTTRLSNLTEDNTSGSALALIERAGRAGPDECAEESGESKKSASPFADEDGRSSSDIPLPVLTHSQLLTGTPTQRRYAHLPALRQKLAELKDSYSVIIVDMSGFSDSADARAVCSMLDGVVIVVGNARKTSIDTLAAALSAFGKSRITLFGMVFNRARKESRRKLIRKGPRT